MDKVKRLYYHAMIVTNMMLADDIIRGLIGLIICYFIAFKVLDK